MLVVIAVMLAGLSAAAADSAPARITGPLVVSGNPNYFQDAGGGVLILNGSQTWNTMQDWGSDGSPRTADFDAFVRFLASHHHNFTLLWYTELPKFSAFPSTASDPPDLTVAPHPWTRTGPGNATDGKPKFDLTKYDEDFFHRLRTRVEKLRSAGIYTGVYLFTGEWLNIFRSPTDGFPFTGANNINHIDDGYRGGKKGVGSIAMTAPNAITAIQDAYVEKVIDTLNDLPNVLWVISEEAPLESLWWNDHQIAHIRAYESRKPYRHPIGYAVIIRQPDTILYNSDADFVKPSVRVSPLKTCGSGKPACKVNVNDSDHSYFGMWHDTPQQNRNYEWKNFMNGNQVLFMDPYLVYYPRERRNMCVSPVNLICSGPDTRYDNFRDNLGYILRYSQKVNLAKVTPRPSLSSTGFCLADASPTGSEYLIYAPDGGAFTVDLSAMPASRRLTVEWFNPASGLSSAGNPVSAGSKATPFRPPFAGDAVLYLADAEGKPKH